MPLVSLKRIIRATLDREAFSDINDVTNVSAELQGLVMQSVIGR
jgi:hypothetical protein